jgi:hypothetical protein
VRDAQQARDEALHRAGQIPADREQQDRVDCVEAIEDERGFQRVEIDGHGGSDPDNRLRTRCDGK